jgi:hypothetical protein
MSFKELEVELIALKDELEAEDFSGSTEDENPDPRLVRVSEIVMLLEVFYFNEYKRIVSEVFGQ